MTTRVPVQLSRWVIAGVVSLALVAGFLLGSLPREPQGTGHANSPAEPVPARLVEPVFQPPDASSLSDDPPSGSEGSAPSAQSARDAHGGVLRCAVLPDGAELCDHGSEEPPPGVDLRRPPTVAQLKARRFGAGQRNAESVKEPTSSAADETAVVTPETVPRFGTVPCIGDGTSGQRVQAIYASASDRPSRYTELLPLLQQYAADASAHINHAAGRSGQGRVIRFVTAGSPCVLDVDNVTLSPSGDDSFANTVAELRQRGYSATDRKYLVWVDAAVGICGIGHRFSDDQPTLANANTRGNMFARVDAPCWGYAELHEMLHTFGAVQDSAPHATGAGHCFDETDALCYSDTSRATMREVCLNEPAWYVDCNLDDYFNAAPSADSYLDTRWNVARSPYLHVTGPPPPSPRLTVDSVSEAFAGNAWTVTAKPVLADTADIADFYWTSSRPDCLFDDAGELTTRYWCPVTAATGGRVRAWLTDSFGSQTAISQEYTLTERTSPRKVDLSLVRSTSRIRAGQTAFLRTRLSDAAGGAGVIGMPVSLYRRFTGQSAWEKIATRNSDSYGRASFGVQPKRTTDYQVVSGYTSTWTTGNGGPARIAVR